MRNRFFAAASARVATEYFNRNRERVSDGLRVATLSLLHVSSLAGLCWLLGPREAPTGERTYLMHRVGWMRETRDENGRVTTVFGRR